MLSEYRDEISKLKQTNAHFAKIFREHNELDEKVKNAEDGIIVMSDVNIEIMKKKKLLLKDEMLLMILKHRKGS